MPDNGKNGSWRSWVNTILIILVGGLLSYFVRGNDARLSHIEEWMEKSERISHLEDIVRTSDVEHAHQAERLNQLEKEMDKLLER